MPNDSVSAADQAAPDGPLTPEEEARLSQIEPEFVQLLSRRFRDKEARDSELRKRVVFERFAWQQLADISDRISGELRPRLQLVDLALWCNHEISDLARDALLCGTEGICAELDQLHGALEKLRRTAGRRVEAALGEWVPLREGEAVAGAVDDDNED